MGDSNAINWMNDEKSPFSISSDSDKLERCQLELAEGVGGCLFHHTFLVLINQRHSIVWYGVSNAT